MPRCNGPVTIKEDTGVRIRYTTAAVAAAALLLAACGGGSSTSSTGSTTASAAASTAASGATMTIWADDKRAAVIKPFAEQFGKENNVTVKVEAISKDLQTTFVTASQAGNAPDVVVGAHDWIGNLVQNGAIDPIQLTSQQKSAYEPISIQAVTYNGQIYGAPYAIENIALIRNTTLAPDNPANMEALVASGQALIKAGKTKEIMALQVGQNGDAYHMEPLLTSGGGALFGQGADGGWDPKQLLINSAGSVKAMEHVKANGEKGTGALKRSIDSTNSIPLFTSGKTAYLVSGPWAVTDIKKANIKYDITAVPAWKDGVPSMPFVGVQSFMVASKGKNKALAQEFVSTVVLNTDMQVALYTAEPRPPALTAAMDKVAATDPDVKKWTTAGAKGQPLPSIPEMAQIWDPVGKAQAAIVGGADVKTTLDAAQKTVQTAINKG